MAGCRSVYGPAVILRLVTLPVPNNRSRVRPLTISGEFYAPGHRTCVGQGKKARCKEQG